MPRPRNCIVNCGKWCYFCLRIQNAYVIFPMNVCICCNGVCLCVVLYVLVCICVDLYVAMVEACFGGGD